MSTEEKKKRSQFKKKRNYIPFVIIGILVAIRAFLPYYIEQRINNTLAAIPGYYGQVEDVDLALWRGGYIIENLYLNKVDAETQVPFLNFPKTDISIEWRSLFKGKIVSEISMSNPEVIYVFEDQQKTTADDANVDDWTKALTDLVPIDINRFEVSKGKVAFVQVTSEPTIDLHINNLNVLAENLKNVLRTDKKLPSTIKATGVSIGQGDFSLDGQMDIFKEIPDVDINMSLKNANATALNDLTKHYAGIDFNKGQFELYSEVAIADGYLKGYLKPILKNSKLVGKEDSFLGTLWEGFVGFFKFILKNQKQNTIATRVPIEGDLTKVKASAWSTFFNIIKNGWIKAYQGDVDKNINYEDAERPKDKK
ncbi:DUF748 domain-containing protein [Aquimarina intermedia]|uniref:Uncharacterized protein DUF748 n=1 Tax=Aquimarina intermedia TaxID=350814 RepID=A0A5S5BZ19_9FLAO|nr:DUF748 domain-containing protein [Aquimarina intermedia]TYP72297.1 uncharacterized protein DUF748 [Aquimarina intermedia]